MTLENKKKKILAKATRILNERGYEETCLNARLCPECGKKLKVMTAHRRFILNYFCGCGYEYCRRI